MSNLANVSLLYRFSFLGTLVLLFFFNMGCAPKRQYLPELDLKDAYIITPDGKVKLELREPRPNDGSIMRYAEIRIVNVDGMSISTYLEPRLFIVYHDSAMRIKFLQNNAFYQLNGGEKKVLR